MTDIPKVITTLNPTRVNSQDGSVNTRTYTKSPESDHPVYYNTNGFAELNLPIIRGGYNLITNVNTLADALKNAPLASALSGSYFDASLVLNPVVLGPNISHLIMDPGTVNNTWTWPDITPFVSYLRSAFPDLYRPGLCWDVMITNNSGVNLVFQVNSPTLPQTGKLYGSSATTFTVQPRHTCWFRTLIANTTLGSERIDRFIIRSA